MSSQSRPDTTFPEVVKQSGISENQPDSALIGADKSAVERHMQVVDEVLSGGMEPRCDPEAVSTAQNAAQAAAAAREKFMCVGSCQDQQTSEATDLAGTRKSSASVSNSILHQKTFHSMLPNSQPSETAPGTSAAPQASAQQIQVPQNIPSTPYIAYAYQSGLANYLAPSQPTKDIVVPTFHSQWAHIAPEDTRPVRGAMVRNKLLGDHTRLSVSMLSGQHEWYHVPIRNMSVDIQRMTT